MNHRFLWLLICLTLGSSSFTVFADTAEMTPVASRLEKYLSKMDKKFDKGAINFTAGWTEIIRQPLDHYKNPGKKNRVLYAAQGAGTGLASGLVDMLGGFLNAGTAFLPQWEIPLPQNGVKAETITGGNAEVFGNETISGSYTNTSLSKISPNL